MQGSDGAAVWVQAGWLPAHQPNHSTCCLCLSARCGGRGPVTQTPTANGCSPHPECPWNCRSIKSQPNEKHKAAIYHFSVLEFSRRNECWFIFVLFFSVVFSRSHNITSLSWERMTFSCRFQGPPPPWIFKNRWPSKLSTEPELAPTWKLYRAPVSSPQWIFHKLRKKFQGPDGLGETRQEEFLPSRQNMAPTPWARLGLSPSPSLGLLHLDLQLSKVRRKTLPTEASCCSFAKWDIFMFFSPFLQTGCI